MKCLEPDCNNIATKGNFCDKHCYDVKAEYENELNKRSIFEIIIDSILKSSILLIAFGFMLLIMTSCSEKSSEHYQSVHIIDKYTRNNLYIFHLNGLIGEVEVDSHQYKEFKIGQRISINTNRTKIKLDE